MVGKVQFLNFSESERIRKKVSLKSNKRHMDFYLLLDNSSRFDNCKQYPNVASQQIWHKCPKCLCNPHPKTKVATTTGKGTPIMLCNAIYYTSVNNSQFSISLSLRPATFQRWAIFKTRAPNDPKMTFCTTKSKTTHALLVLPRPKMSLIFALWTTFFELQAILRQRTKWPVYHFNTTRPKLPDICINSIPNTKLQSVLLYCQFFFMIYRVFSTTPIGPHAIFCHNLIIHKSLHDRASHAVYERPIHYSSVSL